MCVGGLKHDRKISPAKCRLQPPPAFFPFFIKKTCSLSQIELTLGISCHPIAFFSSTLQHKTLRLKLVRRLLHTKANIYTVLYNFVY